MFPKTHTLRPYPPSVTVFGDGASRKLLGLDEVMRMGPNDGLGPFSGEGNGNPLQYSCLENPIDGGDR